MTHLALNLDVIRNKFDVSSYNVVAASKQVLGKGAGSISNSPAGRHILLQHFVLAYITTRTRDKQH